MAKQPVIHSTFVIERSYPATPEAVFRAISDPAKKRRWFAEGKGHDVEEYSLDFRVAGRESARFRFKEGTPLAGIICTTDARIEHIVPNQLVVMSSSMNIADRCISAALATFELVPSDAGTDLIFTHQAAFFEGADGPEMREDGWRKLLDRLGNEFPK